MLEGVTTAALRRGEEVGAFFLRGDGAMVLLWLFCCSVLRVLVVVRLREEEFVATKREHDKRWWIFL